MKSLAGLALGLMLFVAATAAAAQSPDLSVTLTAGPPSPKPGDRFTFDGRVTNHGPGGIQLDAEINLPAGYTPVSATTNAGRLHSGYPTGVFVSDVMLAAGASFDFSTSAELPFDAVPGTVLTGEAEVFPKTSEADPTNNRATATTTVGATPVPTLTEWAMILLGAGLAGGAALTLHQRRRLR